MNNILLKPPVYHAGITEPYEWLFLAGSISGARDWQTSVGEKLLPYFNIVNPRRDNFDVNDPVMEREQIKWEYDHLEFCGNILFFFSWETLAPITLLEFGTVLEMGNRGTKNIHICIHPEYKRKNDVIIQTELRAPNLLKNIYFDLDELVKNVIKSV